MKSGLEIEIGKLEKEIDGLPCGSIVYKTENGRKYPYHVWEEDGHESSVYLNRSALEDLRSAFRKRTELEEKLVEKMEIILARLEDPGMFHTSLRVGKELEELETVGRMYPGHRDGYEGFLSCLYDRKCRDVLILFGQRNTVKENHHVPGHCRYEPGRQGSYSNHKD